MKIHEITEGVNDPHIFKVILTAGGPGSGKSTTINKLVGGTGLKSVNSDTFYEFFAKTQNLDLKSLTGTEKSQELRDLAHEYKNKALVQYLQGRLGMVIDGSGRKFDRVQRSVEMLKDFGYDVMMIFVNTDIETAMKRNLERKRTVPEEYFYKAHRQAKENMKWYDEYFGDNFVVVEDGQDLKPVEKKVRQFLNSPPQNPRAQLWIKSQRNMEL